MHARRARRAHTRVQTNFLDWPGGHAPTDRTIKGYISRVYQWYFIFHVTIIKWHQVLVERSSLSNRSKKKNIYIFILVNR